MSTSAENPSTAVIESPQSQEVAGLYRRATDVARTCREIVLRSSVMIGKSKSRHVRVEGWQAIAVCHNCCPSAGEVERVYGRDGDWIGYKATGYVRNAQGIILATGEGFVGFDEVDRYGRYTWRNRPEYAGRAMAQTRGVSRACRGLFAHVLVLMDAGLSTTPAEEMIIETDPEPQAAPGAAGKHPPPATGAELVHRLGTFEPGLVRDGLCQQGELLAHLAREGGKLGHQGAVAEWPEAAVQWANGEVRRLVEHWRGEKKKTDELRQSWHPGGEELEALYGSLARCRRTWPYVRARLGLEAALREQDLTAEQYDRVMKALHEEPARD